MKRKYLKPAIRKSELCEGGIICQSVTFGSGSTSTMDAKQSTPDFSFE